MAITFKGKVLLVVKKIPRGRVLSYAEVARLAGSPSAFRAVGNILHKNKNPKIPCHRVILASGGLGGYRWGIKRKADLLKKEKAI